MSREIKFRAWVDSEMIDSDHLAFTDYGLLKDQLASESCLMQYTGLKDKNGVEIYEGDVINIFLGNRKWCGGGSVRFCNGGFQCNDMVLQDIYHENLTCEVIGRIIQENPELLES